jgi:hypothetical protein
MTKAEEFIAHNELHAVVSGVTLDADGRPSRHPDDVVACRYTFADGSRRMLRVADSQALAEAGHAVRWFRQEAA